MAALHVRPRAISIYWAIRMTERLSGLRILVIELGGGHDEVLLSWYRDLAALGAEVYVACPGEIWKRLGIKDAAGWLGAAAVKGLAGRLKTCMDIRKYVRAHRITHVVLNTASGTAIPELSMLLPRHCVILGTLHDAARLFESYGQRITTRNVDAYTVLAPYLLDRVPSQFQKRIAVVPATAIDPSVLAKPNEAARYLRQEESGPMRVVIAGGIDWARRDFQSLFTTDAAVRMGDRVRIVLAGRSNPAERPRLQSMLKNMPPEMIEVHDGYVPHDVYAHIIGGADVVLPLTHPSCSDYQFYVRSRITGAMSNAWAYAKPLMLERGFQAHASLATSIFYDVKDLPDMLRSYANDPASLIPHAVTPSFATNESRRSAIVGLLN